MRTGVAKIFAYVRACDSMTIMHPVTWSRPLTPTDLESCAVTVVEGGARAAGGHANALVVADTSEQERRTACGLGEVTSLGLLDAVMNLPLCTPVRTRDVSMEALARLAAAPEGIVRREDGWVTRLLSPPLTVVAAIVRGTGWRRPAERVGRFAPFAQQIVILDWVPARGSSIIWEAQLAGIGVWVFAGGQVIELVPPEPFARRFWKPAGWRFAERAYRAQLISSGRRGSSPASADRRSRTGTAACSPLQPVLPSM